MVVEYKRTLEGNYMVIREVEEKIKEGEEAFCIKMLGKNTIDNIIPIEERIINGDTHLYYDITYKQSFDNVYVKSTMSYDQVKKLLINIIDTIERASEYLLNENDFILKSKYIYLDLKSGDANLSYLSGYHKDIKEQMGDLMEDMMNVVDYKDRAGVRLVYDLYGACKEEGYTLSYLKELILSSNQEEVVEEKKQVDNKKADKDFKIPVMKEKTTGEEEVSSYPIKTYLLTGLAVLGGILILFVALSSGFVNNSLGTKIDHSRLLILFLIIACLEAYLIKFLWDDKNKIAKIVSTEEYINPVEPATNPSDKALEVYTENDHEYNPTCLLSDMETSLEIESSYCLEPANKEVYETIHLKSFPYFIGKLKKQMNYCLDYQGISRYHAKITQEGDKYYITDLNSTNGTCLNKDLIQPYEPMEIQEGDQVTLANISYKFTRA